MTPVVLAVALGVLAAPLLTAGVAKLLADPTRLAWPHHHGLLAAPTGPRLVGGLELIAGLLLLVAPTRIAAGVGLLAYGALAVAALRLRGARCACFGVARLAAVGRGHVALNVALAAGAVLPLVVEGPGPVFGRWPAAVVAALAVLMVVRRLDRQAVVAAPTRCTEPIRGVRLYVSADCPACRSLSQLLDRLEPARRDAVRRQVVSRKTDLPEDLQELGVPCATALDAHGDRICAPVSGIGEVKALVDQVVIGGVERVTVR